jgi:hypothetical protein
MLFIIPLLTRYDYNLTIMKSPKTATDNRLHVNEHFALWQIQSKKIYRADWYIDLNAFLCKISSILLSNNYTNFEDLMNFNYLTRYKFDSTGGKFVEVHENCTARNFSMSGINSGHHNLPTYEMSLKSDNVEFVRYCGGHFENGDR